MASSSQSFTSSLLLATIAALLITPTTSQNCTSQTFSNGNTTYTNCSTLPTLQAVLHWTYNPTTRPNPTLDIAFIAPPPSPDGWVAWALNPTGTGMLGAQSLVAFRDTNGSMVVRTYNIASYSSIAESRISYNVLSRHAEFSGGVMRIFATLTLPSGGREEVNQVWQVGATVTNGVPQRHAFSADNLGAKSTLRVVGTAVENGNRTAAAPTSGGAHAPPPGRQSGNDNGGSSRVGVGLYGVLMLLGVWILCC